MHGPKIEHQSLFAWNFSFLDRCPRSHLIIGFGVDFGTTKMVLNIEFCKFSSLRKGGTYHEDDFGEDAMMLVGAMRDVYEAGAFVAELQVLSMKEKVYLPSGWMKWQSDLVSTVEGWMSILVPSFQGESQSRLASTWGGTHQSSVAGGRSFQCDLLVNLVFIWKPSLNSLLVKS